MMQLGDMKLLPHSDPLSLDIYDDESLRERFRDDPPRLTLPVMWDFDLTLDDGTICKAEDGWGGPPVHDPLTLYLHLPLSAEEEGVVFTCTLEEVIVDLIDSSLPGNSTDGKVDVTARAICQRIAARLRELAERLEQACAAN